MLTGQWLQHAIACFEILRSSCIRLIQCADARCLSNSAEIHTLHPHDGMSPSHMLHTAMPASVAHPCVEGIAYLCVEGIACVCVRRA